MKHKGYWVYVIVTMILTVILVGDTGVRRVNSDAADRTNVASISVNSAADITEVTPGKIPIVEAWNKQNETGSNSNNNELDISDDTNISERSAQPGEEESDTLDITLLTFNIHSANNAAGTVLLEQIIEEVKETGAQIVGLQEVERLMPRSGYQDQAKVIAEELGYYYYYGGNINILGVQYGNAFLSKYPILEVRNHKLPRELLEPRGIIEAVVDVEGTPFNVYVTHLGLNPDERRKQISYINDLISQKGGNIILLGDFNNKPDSREMSYLDTRMVDSAAVLGHGSEYTYSNWDDMSRVRIDRIYVSDNIKLTGSRVMTSLVSDHKGVLTQIMHEINPSEGIYKVISNTDRD